MQHEKILVVYLSMGFGNPYGDPYNVDFVQNFVRKLVDMDIQIISLADTIGVSNPENISYLFGHLIPQYPKVEFGAHLHSTPDAIYEKVDAAYKAGCLRFDGAINGFGGCPMAKDDLVGNMATEAMISYFNDCKVDLNIDRQAFLKAQQLAFKIFPVK